MGSCQWIEPMVRDIPTILCNDESDWFKHYHVIIRRLNMVCDWKKKIGQFRCSRPHDIYV